MLSHPHSSAINMSQFESLLGSSSSSSSEVLDSRDDLQRRKERASRTLRMVGTCKGNFTKEIKKLVSTAEYFLAKTADHTDDQTNLPELTVINCAQAFLDSLDRLIAKYIVMERNLDDWKNQITEIWEDTDEELVNVIAKQEEGFANYDKE